MKEKHTQMWIPLYVDKWIFGSTRIELEPAERGVFVDLMVLGAKDSGYIRANETTPFLKVQIAGILNIPIELLESTLAKCVHHGKLEEPTPGIFRLCNWEKFQLSDDYKYRIESGKRSIPGSVRQNSDSSPKNSDNSPTNLGPIREDKIREENRREDAILSSGSQLAFNQVWQNYPPKRRGRMGEALTLWAQRKAPQWAVEALKELIKSEEWTKEDGKYIPSLSKWIDGQMWDSVLTTHNIVTCHRCGNGGVLHKSKAASKVTCRSCHAEAQKAKEEAIAGEIRGIE